MNNLELQESIESKVYNYFQDRYTHDIGWQEDEDGHCWSYEDPSIVSVTTTALKVVIQVRAQCCSRPKCCGYQYRTYKFPLAELSIPREEIKEKYKNLSRLLSAIESCPECGSDDSPLRLRLKDNSTILVCKWCETIVQEFFGVDGISIEKEIEWLKANTSQQL